MAQQEKKTAGIFDIRNIIGALLTIYGVILTLMGLFADPETEKTGGSNANLVAGIVLLDHGPGVHRLGLPAAGQGARARRAGARRPDPSGAEEEAAAGALRRAPRAPAPATACPDADGRTRVRAWVR